MHSDKTGVELNAEISVSVNWASFLEKVLGAVSEAVKASQGDIVAGAKSLLSLYQSAGAFKVDQPIGATGVELILLSFAIACDTTNPSTENAAWLASARSAIAGFKKQLEAGRLTIPHDFFEQPAASSVYQSLRDNFVAELSSRRAHPIELESSLKSRMDIAFRSGVWQLSASRHATFERLAAALNSPSASATDFDRQWRSYKAKLISDFHLQPVFGQEESGVSLGALYVPLRCTWSQKQALSEREDNGLLNNRGQETEEIVTEVRWVEDELFAWVNQNPSEDWLRLIGGGPGSGKSTSAKAFSAQLASRDDLRVLFIPLQRLDANMKLRDAINSYFTARSGSPFVLPPLDRRQVESGPRLVLIFDGLDEIARPGDSANEIARDMIDRIRSLHSELTGDTTVGHKCLVTGRTVSFDAARKTADRKGREAVEVIGYAPVDRIRGTFNGPNGILQLDQRPDWWKKYSTALSLDSETPPAFSDHRLLSVTSEPLLCYLLGLSGYLEGNSAEAADNRNNVYQRLLSAVWERGWGGGRAGKGKSLSQEHFNQLFETMALAAWHGGDERVATFDRFEAALKITGADEIYRQFSATEGSDVSNLAVNFYLKQPDANTKGVEFTHKSFGEYLAARAMFRIVRAVADISRSRPEVGIADWLRAVSDGRLTFELLYFLRDEARLIAATDLVGAVDLKNQLTKLFGRVIREGFPAHTVHSDNWRHAEDRQRRTEGLLLAIINSLAIGIHQMDKLQSLVEIDWPDIYALGRLMHRLRGVRGEDIPEQLIFGHLSALSPYLLGQEMINFNLDYSNFEGALISRAQLPGASLVGASLRSARLIQTNMTDTDLQGADLTGATFDDVDALAANFTGTNLRGVKFGYSNIAEAKFSGAVFEDTILEGTEGPKARLTKKQKAGLIVGEANIQVSKIAEAKTATKLARLQNREARGIVNKKRPGSASRR